MTIAVPLWRKIQRENFTDWNTLLTFLELDNPGVVTSPFPLNLPKRLAAKIVKGCWEDPLLRQFLPSAEEKTPSPLFVRDAVGDCASKKTAKLLHKYQGRALLLASSACAMHCRYCFRRHFDYEVETPHFEAELAAIRGDPSLSEILLSGGDPLSLSNTRLHELLQGIAAIPHIKRIRFHTRFPLGIPERIDTDFLHLLESCPAQIFFVIHCNHAQEFDKEIFAHLKQVQQLGIPILSQSVLLKGVNDTVAPLEELFTLLVDHGIIPYYLHQLDRIEGAAHFEVEETQGLALMSELQKRLPGYALPRYVRETPSHPHKTLIQPLA